jgi:hypothetical protein
VTRYLKDGIVESVAKAWHCIGKHVPIATQVYKCVHACTHILYIICGERKVGS